MENISIICAVMNRPERVLDAIDNWSRSLGVSEIVLIDWSSSISVNSLIKEYPPNHTPALRIYRVEGESRWILSQAYNLALKLATSRWVAKMDIDYRIDSDFFSAYCLDRRSFVRGHWAAAINPEDKNLCGFLLAERHALLLVNGYNENIVSYGYDDIDICDRLCRIGKIGHVLIPLSIYHVPHSDIDRIVNQDIEDRSSSNVKNSMIAMSQLTWDSTAWIQINENTFVRGR